MTDRASHEGRAHAMAAMTAAAWLITVVCAIGPAASARATPPHPRAQPGAGPGLAVRSQCMETVLPQGGEQRWRGTWAGDGGWEYSYVLHLTRRGSALSGYFEWTLRVAADASMTSRVGQSAREYVRGTLDATNCTVALTGYRRTDTTLIGLDQYSITLAPTGGLDGRTRGGVPYWSARINGTRAQ